MSAINTLLKFAANAAGKKITWHLIGTINGDREYASTDADYCTEWNPLTSSADALELAAALCFTIQIGKLDGTVVVTSNNDDRIYSAERYETEADKMGAIRMAIVVAAADLGMKIR
jgi:hypothetical protein